MDSRGTLHNRDLRVHHKANPWQVRIHGSQAADYRIHHGETLAVPGGLIEILKHGPPSLSPVKRVSRIDLYQSWPRRINTGNLCQVHTRNVLDICSRDSLG